MRSHGRISAPAGVVALIAAVTVVPLAVFLWLGVRLLDQDRRLEEQQVRDRLQTGVDLVVAKLQRMIGASEQRLAEGRDDWPDGAIAVTFSRGGCRDPARRANRVPAGAPRAAGGPRRAFSRRRRARVPERRSTWRHRGISTPRCLLGSAVARVRCSGSRATSMRSAGIPRRSRFTPISQSVVDIVEAGVPLGLAASWARCSLLQRLNREDDLEDREASRLHQDLSAGRWPVLEPAYVTYFLDAERWAGRPRVTSRRGDFQRCRVGVVARAHWRRVRCGIGRGAGG